jgi:hypothetical protein
MQVIAVNAVKIQIYTVHVQPEPAQGRFYSRENIAGARVSLHAFYFCETPFASVIAVGFGVIVKLKKVGLHERISKRAFFAVYFKRQIRICAGRKFACFDSAERAAL